MTCTVSFVRGLTVVPSVTWTGPDGNLTNAENITVEPAQTFGLVIRTSMTLHYLQPPEGGRYLCKAAVIIPTMGRSLSKLAYKQLLVLSM